MRDAYPCRLKKLTPKPCQVCGDHAKMPANDAREFVVRRTTAEFRCHGVSAPLPIFSFFQARKVWLSQRFGKLYVHPNKSVHTTAPCNLCARSSISAHTQSFAAHATSLCSPSEISGPPRVSASTGPWLSRAAVVGLWRFPKLSPPHLLFNCVSTSSRVLFLDATLCCGGAAAFVPCKNCAKTAGCVS